MKEKAIQVKYDPIKEIIKYNLKQIQYSLINLKSAIGFIERGIKELQEKS